MEICCIILHFFCPPWIFEMRTFNNFSFRFSFVFSIVKEIIYFASFSIYFISFFNEQKNFFKICSKKIYTRFFQILEKSFILNTILFLSSFDGFKIFRFFVRYYRRLFFHRSERSISFVHR